jgi:hypothetical protein
MYSSTHSLTLALDGGELSASHPGRFTPRERDPGTHWIGGWVGPRAVLDAVVKRKIPIPRRESNPITPIVQHVAQRYTDWAITVLHINVIFPYPFSSHKEPFYRVFLNKLVYGCLINPILAKWPTNIIFRDFVTLIKLDEGCKLWSFTLCSFLRPHVTFSLLGQIFSSAPCSQA